MNYARVIVHYVILRFMMIYIIMISMDINDLFFFGFRSGEYPWKMRASIRFGGASGY